MLAAAGCTKYPQVEFQNLKYVAALRTACSARNPEWLQQTVAEIDRAREAGEMSPEEYAAYQTIIAQAQAGQWREAEQACFEFQQDQLAR